MMPLGKSMQLIKIFGLKLVFILVTLSICFIPVKGLKIKYNSIILERKPLSGAQHFKSTNEFTSTKTPPNYIQFHAERVNISTEANICEQITNYLKVDLLKEDNQRKPMSKDMLHILYTIMQDQSFNACVDNSRLSDVSRSNIEIGTSIRNTNNDLNEDRLYIPTLLEQNALSESQEDIIPSIDFRDPILYLKLAASFVLVCLSGLFSGLTLGILGMDINTLTIATKSNPKALHRRYARWILPFRSRGNLLLCTLLLGNVSVNAAFSILTSDLTSGFVGFFVSSILIVIFGEIIPQALCSRYGLLIGGVTLPILGLFMFLLYPIAFPLSVILDFLLGKEVGTIYSKDGLKQLLLIHAKDQSAALVPDSVNILYGAMDYPNLTVAEVMQPLDSCFMLDLRQQLDISTLHKIWSTGHSRIPIYERERNNIVGLVFAKDFILVNPDDYISLESVMTFFGREALRVFENDHLNHVLDLFKSGKSHMALVQQVVEIDGQDPFYKTVGIVTLEDVIEEILLDEIVDETDTRPTDRNLAKKEVDVDKKEFHNTIQSPSTENSLVNIDFDIVPSVRPSINMFNQHEPILSVEEREIISTFLSRSSKFFQMFSFDILSNLTEKAMVSVIGSDSEPLYSIGEKTSIVTLVLSGCLEVTNENGESIKRGSWSILCLEVFLSEFYTSEYNVRAIRDSLVLQISQKDFIDAVREVTQSSPRFQLPSELNWLEFYGIQPYAAQI